MNTRNEIYDLLFTLFHDKQWLCNSCKASQADPWFSKTYCGIRITVYITNNHIVIRNNGEDQGLISYSDPDFMRKIRGIARGSIWVGLVKK